MRLTQVLDNPVSNALRHTPQGGTVHLGADRREDAIRFAIADSGAGIAPEDLERVFERFYRVAKARSGNENSSGPGLAIAKAIVTAHGGRIWVESKSGCGAKFRFELPL